MEHTEAVQLKAAERYLLGELSSEVRDQFEEHFFSCAECAREVGVGATFIDAAREVFSSEEAAARAPRTPRREARGWFALWLRPAFIVPALAVLFLVVAYQNVVVMPRMRAALSESNAPQTLSWFSIMAENSRGGAQQKISVPRGRPFSLFVDIPIETHFASYSCDLETESGTFVHSWAASPEETGKAVQVLIPPSMSKPGKYVLVVRGLGAPEEAGASKVEVARYPFTLEYAQ
jgi:hypothetical protein